jgi:hypothetical protein
LRLASSQFVHLAASAVSAPSTIPEYLRLARILPLKMSFVTILEATENSAAAPA